MRIPKPCRCGSGLTDYELLDANHIHLAFVCQKCEAAKRATYNPWVFTGYNQAFLDEESGERLEPEDY